MGYGDGAASPFGFDVGAYWVGLRLMVGRWWGAGLLPLL